MEVLMVDLREVVEEAFAVPVSEDVGPLVPVLAADDTAAEVRWPWLGPRWATLFTMSSLGLFSLGGLFIANPFTAETSASAAPDYWGVMYLDGLLIGLAVLGALLTCQVFSLRSPRRAVAGGDSK